MINRGRESVNHNQWHACGSSGNFCLALFFLLFFLIHPELVKFGCRCVRDSSLPPVHLPCCSEASESPSSRPAPPSCRQRLQDSSRLQKHQIKHLQPLNLALASGPGHRSAPSEPWGRHHRRLHGWFPRMKLSPASSPLLRSIFVERSHANTGAKTHTHMHTVALL